MKFVTEKGYLITVILSLNINIISFNNLQVFLWGRLRRFSGFSNFKIKLEAWHFFNRRNHKGRAESIQYETIYLSKRSS